MFYCLSCLPSYLRGLSLVLSICSSVKCVSSLGPRPYLSAFLNLYLAYILTELTLFEAWLMIDLSFEQHPKKFFQPPKLKSFAKRRKIYFQPKGSSADAFRMDTNSFMSLKLEQVINILWTCFLKSNVELKSQHLWKCIIWPLAPNSYMKISFPPFFFLKRNIKAGIWSRPALGIKVFLMQVACVWFACLGLLLHLHPAAPTSWSLALAFDHLLQAFLPGSQSLLHMLISA